MWLTGSTVHVAEFVVYFGSLLWSYNHAVLNRPDKESLLLFFVNIIIIDIVDLQIT